MSTRKIRILVYSPAPLFHAIRHILADRDEYEIVGRRPSLRGPVETSGPGPEVIVVNVKPVGTGICAAVLAIKHSRPHAKLILICPLAELNPTGRRCGADACLVPGELFTRLSRTVSALSRGAVSEKKSRIGVAS